MLSKIKICIAWSLAGHVRAMHGGSRGFGSQPPLQTEHDVDEKTSVTLTWNDDSVDKYEYRIQNPDIALDMDLGDVEDVLLKLTAFAKTIEESELRKVAELKTQIVHYYDGGQKTTAADRARNRADALAKFFTNHPELAVRFGQI